ncbi:MAG: hypothetical protein U0X86_000273 [Wolbachia endosymbiont of Xenopsylla cheopis]
MISNTIFTKDDKKELANFLFQCLSDGVSKERINNLAQIWIEKGGEVNISSKYEEIHSAGDGVCYFIFILLGSIVYLGCTASIENKGIDVIVSMGLAALIPLGFLVFVGCLISRHVGDKKYASACAEKTIDNHNIKCYKELENVVQNSQNLISEILDNNEYAKIYPELPCSDDQMIQFVINAPLKNSDSVVIYK